MAVPDSRRTILHYPRLDTVLMVEQFIRDHSGEYRKRALWERLPKKMMYNTFQTVFDYLFSSGKIAKDPAGKICWIWNPGLVRRYMRDATLVVK
jgi:hypothetical protein